MVFNNVDIHGPLDADFVVVKFDRNGEMYSKLGLYFKSTAIRCADHSHFAAAVYDREMNLVYSKGELPDA